MDSEVETEKVVSMNREIRFKETQKFTQWWLWLIILAPIIIIALRFISSYLYLFGVISTAESNNTSMTWIAYKVSLVELLPHFFYLLTVLFLILLKLKVVVTEKEINIHHLLFYKKTIKLSDVIEHRITNYDFVGYGIRKTQKYGTVYNVKGKQGISLTLKNGDKYLIGSQRPQELLKSISNNS